MNYAERLQRQITERAEETRVVFLTGETFGPDANFPQKAEIVHGGQLFEATRLIVEKRIADNTGIKGDDRKDFFDRMTASLGIEREMQGPWREMMLSTLLESGVVQKIGWTGPRFVSKARAKKWIDGGEPIDDHGERIEAPPSADVFAKEDDAWVCKGLSGEWSMLAPKSFKSKVEAEEWRKERTDNLAELNVGAKIKALHDLGASSSPQPWRASLARIKTNTKTEEKAKALEELGEPDGFSEEFLSTKEGGQYAARQIIVEMLKAVTFEKSTPMFVVGKDVFLEAHQTDDPKMIEALLRADPAVVLDIYRARTQWDENKRREREEAAKNSSAGGGGSTPTPASRRELKSP